MAARHTLVRGVPQNKHDTALHEELKVRDR